MLPGNDNPKRESALSRWLGRKKEVKAVDEATGDIGALSHGQLRLFLLQELFPSNPFYHYAEIYHLSGHVDLLRLRKSIERVVLVKIM